MFIKITNIQIFFEPDGKHSMPLPISGVLKIYQSDIFLLFKGIKTIYNMPENSSAAIHPFSEKG
jgi:hypothetical protein